MIEPEIPGYSIEKRLGRGGMASVYLATQTSMQRRLALKVMSNQLGEDSVWAKRFIQEAQVIARLSHPNIVPVYDVGSHDGQFYISMEYLAGGSLKTRMAKGIPIPEVLKIIAGVAAGLDYAGEKGFVHRDIKPDNVMFRTDGSPVILDFGIVKQMDEGPTKMTQTGVIVGTTSYMSPEQAQGRELDQRSDIYSLGVMFFELLTGKPPFKGETDVATLLLHINEPVPRLHDILTVFQPIIDKALAKDPFHRYHRAREMIDHIQALEPKIKSALVRLRVGNTSEPTVVKNAPGQLDDDATKVVGSEAITGQITSEEELTQVLSSAKATIRDFSAEARRKRARRNRNMVYGMSMVACLALAYVGFQQLYLVPRERAAAEAKIRAAELKTQRKIDALLARAKTARSGLLPNQFARMDEVIALYRQVLTLDPENEAAQFVLQKLGERYIEMAKGAVRRGDSDKAISYQNYAEQLAPENPALIDLRDAIKALRSEAIDREFVREKVDTLISVALSDIENSEGFSDAAYTKLQQALRIDPANGEAASLVRAMLDRLYDTTEQDVAKGRIGSARGNLEILKKYHGDQHRLAALESRLGVIATQLSRRQKLTTLVGQADRLQREKRTIAINDQLRGVYLAMLKMATDNAIAKKGLDDTSAFEAKLAEQAMRERDFIRANNQIRVIEQYTPRYPELSALKAQLTGARAAAAKADEILAEAKTLISTDADGDDRRRELLTASNRIEEARLLDANNPAIPEVLGQLESKYVTTITQLISASNEPLVQAYFGDTVSRYWPTDRLLRLQQTHKQTTKKSKPKRVITGGF